MDREEFISQVVDTQKAFRRFLCALCCGDSQLADDIAQEAFMKAYLSIDSLNNPDKFKAWIFRIGYTTFVNQKRSHSYFLNYEEAEGVAANDATDGSFKYQELYAALNKLRDKERMSVLLFYMEGYPIKEIAELIDATQSAVKQYLSRGRNHLRGLLESQ